MKVHSVVVSSNPKFPMSSTLAIKYFLVLGGLFLFP